MTPKEKALELLEQFDLLVTSWDCYNDKPYKDNGLVDKKECALVVVEEILKISAVADAHHMFIMYPERDNYTQYWTKVKEEINLL